MDTSDPRSMAIQYQRLSAAASKFARAARMLGILSDTELRHAQHDAARLAEAARERTERLHRRETHDFRIETLSNVYGRGAHMRFRDRCDCGWVGEWMPTAGLAHSAHDAHRASVQAVAA